MLDVRSPGRNSGITAANWYGSDTFGAAVDPNGNHLYVTNGDADQVEVIAPR